MKTISDVNKLVQELKNGTKKLFYCSMAEIFQTNFALNVMITDAAKKRLNGDFEKSLDTILDAIENENNISTEIVANLIFTLVSMNEFYYVGVLAEICSNYFKKGDYTEVPALDKPYINAAKDISLKRFNDIKFAYDYALKDNFEPLRKLILENSNNKISYDTAFIKDKDIIKNDINAFLNCDAIADIDKCEHTTGESQECYRKSNLCQYCGGKFKGIFNKRCSVCGKPKDY